MKKILIMLLGIIIMGVATVYADTPPLISVEYEQIDNGYEAVFNISDNPGISSFKFFILCKNGAIPKEIIKNEALNGGIFQSNINEPILTEDGTIITVLWINSANYQSDGNIFTVLFETQNSAEPNIYLSYEAGDVIDEGFNDVPLIIDEKLVPPKENETETPKEDDTTIIPDKSQNNNGGHIINNSSNLNKDSDEENKEDLQQKDENEVAFSFLDVKETDWYYEDIQYVVENKLMNGLSEVEFAPNYTLTRSMLVTVLYRNEVEPVVNKSIPFADVDMSSWYANAVIWAKQNGIVKGVSETEFAPNDNITREQIAVIMHRYAQYKEYDVSVGENTNILSYNDIDSVSEYAISSMQWACGSGLMKGKTESTLNTLDNATRAEIAAILHRFIEANK